MVAGQLNVSVIMISAGVDQWDELTTPAVESLNKHAKTPYELIVMDNGGKCRGAVNTDEMVPYATAVNLTAQYATTERLLILNNDIIARGNWQSWIYSHEFCGPVLLKKEGVEYIEGWCISIARDLWHMLGGFNEVYKNSWEDVDLAWRACRLGVLPRRIPMPMKHIWGATRHAIPGSNKWDEKNRQMLLARKLQSRFKWRRI